MSYAAQSSTAAEPTPTSSPSPIPSAIVIQKKDPKESGYIPLYSTAAPKFGLTATGINIMAGKIKAGEVCAKDLEATKDTLVKCQDKQVPPLSVLQRPVVIVGLALAALVLGFGIAKLTQGSPSSSAAQPAALPAALVRF